jgi:hypothetical protein
MKPYRYKSGSTGASFSWGHYATKWIYGDTLEDAVKQGFDWVEEQRKKEVEKAKEANTYEEK